jgi:hypothetical protein
MNKIRYPRLALCSSLARFGEPCLVICEKDSDSKYFKATDFSRTQYFVNRKDLKFISNKSKHFKTACEKAKKLNEEVNYLNLAIANNSK